MRNSTLTARFFALFSARYRAHTNAVRRQDRRNSRIEEVATPDRRKVAAELIALEIRGARSQQGKVEAQDQRRREQARTARLALLGRCAPTDLGPR